MQQEAAAIKSMTEYQTVKIKKISDEDSNKEGYFFFRFTASSKMIRRSADPKIKHTSFFNERSVFFELSA